MVRYASQQPLGENRGERAMLSPAVSSTGSGGGGGGWAAAAPAAAAASDGVVPAAAINADTSSA
jgi:hypothetical protein